ncbi:alpha-amylase family glycosyl hydrolase [Alteromonas sp. S167]|uniref:alpha-amylase family glycosyl hydrolase n=1 Tax=Alteromonas sp. S167 TaxID=3117402 RepID=UPI002FE12252
MKKRTSIKLLTLSVLLGCLSACDGNEKAAIPHNTALTHYLQRDIQEDSFYFVMPDRFYNGNTENDLGAPVGSISHGGFEPTSKWAFHGGDMAGIEQKLDYLEGMGITAIWMTPILRNKAVQDDGIAHHGYWIVDFTEIDPHFGSNADLKQLIDAAHSRNIKVFFDIITNHTADVIKYEECHQKNGEHLEGRDHCEYRTLAEVKEKGTLTPFITADEESVKSPEWLNDTRYYHNQGDTSFQGENSLFGDFNGLDDINTEHPDVVSGMIDIYKNLITEFKPDGFRIDTVRHVQLPFWQAFSPAIMAHAHKEGIPKFHIFGEVYDASPKALSLYTTEGKLPAVLDFGFQDAARHVFFDNSKVSKLASLIEQDNLYNDDNSDVTQLLTFLGNHDMGRPGHFINSALSDAPHEEKLQRSILAHAFMYFSRGVPVVYYGDEQGFTGDGNDVDAREDMMPSYVASYNDNDLLGTNATTVDDNFDTKHPIYQAISTFANIRKQLPVLQYGEMKTQLVDNSKQVYTYVRTSDVHGSPLFVAFNASTQKQVVKLDASFAQQKHLFGDARLMEKDGVVQLALPALSFGIFAL